MNGPVPIASRSSRVSSAARDRGRNDAGVGVGEHHRQVGIGRPQLEDDCRRIARRHAFDRADILARRRGGLGVEHRLEGRDDIGGGAGRAVMEERFGRAA